MKFVFTNTISILLKSNLYITVPVLLIGLKNVIIIISCFSENNHNFSQGIKRARDFRFHTYTEQGGSCSRCSFTHAFYSNLLVSLRYLCFPKKAPVRKKNVVISNVPTGSD